MHSTRQKGFTIIELLMALWLLFCVACAIGSVWIIVHFVAKFW